MRKRWMPVFLTLCMVFMLLPGAKSVSAAEDGDLFVGGVALASGQYLENNRTKVTTEKPTGEGYAYRDGNNLLLYNYIYKGAGYHNAAIYSDIDLNIILEGSSSVMQSSGSAEDSYGVYCDGMLTVSGQGSLTAKGGSAGNNSYGIYGLSEDADGISIREGFVTGIGGDAGDNSFGIYGSSDRSNGLVISGGTVAAYGGAAGDDSCGICGKSSGNSTESKGIELTDGIITAVGGNAKDISYGAYGKHSDKGIGVCIANGEINAIGGDAGSESFGIRGSGENGEAVCIEDGIINAAGGRAEGNSVGIYGSLSSKDAAVHISGGNVNAAGGVAIGKESSSYGIIGFHRESDGVGILITNGRITATSGEAKLYSIGLYGNGDNSVELCGGITIARAGLTGQVYNETNRYAVLGDDGSIALQGSKVIGAVGYKAGSFTMLDKYSIIELPEDGACTVGGKGKTGKKIPATSAIFVPESWSETTLPKADAEGVYTIERNTAIVTDEKRAITLKDGAGIYINPEITLVAVSLYEGDIQSENEESTAGIFGEGAFKLSGEGNILAAGGMACGDGSLSIGIHGNNASSVIQMVSGTVDAIAGSASSSNGILGRTSISGGNIIAYGSNAWYKSCGISGNVDISGGDISVFGGAIDSMKEAPEGESYGIFGFGTNITGGNIIAFGGTASEISCGIAGYNIAFNNSTVISVGGAGKQSYGVYAKYKIYDITKRGTGLLIAGNTSMFAAGYPMTAAAGTEPNCCGIYGVTTGNGFGISITDNVEVYASGDTGIYGCITGEGSGVNIAGGKIHGTISSGKAVTEQPSPETVIKETSYTVVKGDTLRKIAQKYNTTVKMITELNGLKNPDIIRIGQILLIP